MTTMTIMTITTELAEAHAEIARLRAESARRLCALYDVYHRADPHPAASYPDRDTPAEYDRLIAEVTDDLATSARELAELAEQVLTA